MADSKASALTLASSLTGAELWAGVQGGADRKITAALIAAYVIGQLQTGAPAALDTLDELAAALGDDANYAATMVTALAGKQPLASALTAIAALTTSSWGRDLLTLANAAALRDLLACANIVHQSAVNSNVTGTTTQTTLATFTIPANSLGPNGSADMLMLFGYTSSANAKYLRLTINGTLVLSLTPTTTGSGQFLFSIANRNDVASQVANATGLTGFGSATGVEQTFSFDTTTDMTVTITGELSNSSEEIRLARRRCIVFHGA